MKQPLASPITAICSAALLLAGCNGPVSNRPLLKLESGERIALKTGLWSSEIACDTKTRSLLPLCSKAAPHFVVTQHDLRPILAPSVPAELRSDVDSTQFHYVMTWGDPFIVQIEVAEPAGDGKRHSEFTYAALQPTERDAAGNVIAADAWPILCGPPPAPGDWNYGMQSEESEATNRPFKGMTMGDVQCTPRDQPTLQAAAKASRTLSDRITLRYVRDDDPSPK